MSQNNLPTANHTSNDQVEDAIRTLNSSFQGTQYYSFTEYDTTDFQMQSQGGLVHEGTLINQTKLPAEEKPSLPQKRTDHDAEHSEEGLHTKRRQAPTHMTDKSTFTSDGDSRETGNAQSSVVKTYTLDPPEWSSHKDAWGYMQSLRPIYKSAYLTRTNYGTSDRTGYLFGRNPKCDFIFDRLEISQWHCLIYMENENDGTNRQIRVYLLDYSSNGTFVNGKRVGTGNRVELRSGDRIQLYMRSAYCDNTEGTSDTDVGEGSHGAAVGADEDELFYRIILPTRFETGAFSEEYEIINGLGKGSAASVYKARQKQTNEVVAVKILSKLKMARHPKILASILQEIGILMSLEAHPGVIQIGRIYNEPKYIFLILEYVERGDLFNYISEKRYLIESEARFVFWQLFSAIKFLHFHGITHRDLKPENVLLVNENTLHVKIADFGLAKINHGMRLLSSQCGTPNYVAPEILDPSSARAYGQECDLWSLGVMLYICLCGFPPFSEELAPPTMREQIRKGIFHFTSPFWDNISKEAKDLIQSLLTVDPLKRASAVDALAHPWMSMEPEKLELMFGSLDPKDLVQMICEEQTPLQSTQAMDI